VDGVVQVDQVSCLGKDNCDSCLQACPYDAPQFGPEENAKMQKCDFCLDRITKGQKPVCVDACPMRAMDAGPIEDLIAKYGDSREAEGFIYSEKLAPSVVFRGKVDTKGLALQKIEIAPEPCNT
jgi:anaerobic dimethyl sulfoxide reductase subunit B (iron-sulfur subunit)